MKQIVKIIICIFIAMSLFGACRPQDEGLEKALRLAKGNRAELEKVLRHYQNDSLKLEAAKFLIRYMPGHYSYADTSICLYYNAVDSTLRSMQGKPVVEIKDSLELITDKFASIIQGDTVQDVEVVKADYLIANIDTAFAQWEHGHWATHLDFGQFCEYLLPYKVFECQYLDNWREYLEETFGREIEKLYYCDLFRHSAIQATNHVNNNLRKELHLYLSTHRIAQVGRLSTWQKVPNNVSWIPICFGRIEGGKARFKEVGRDIAYLPLRYEGSDRAIPAGNPFVLTCDGKVKELSADTLCKQEVSLVRKYPVLPYVYMWAWRTAGGMFQAANNPQFRNARTIYEIKDCGVTGVEVNVPDSCGAYRYWRYWHPTEFVNMAEMYFVERHTGEFVEGKIIGTKGSWDNNGSDRSKTFDRDLLTYFDSPTSDAYVGMDFGKPVEIGKILYTHRGDGNTIDIGDTYELFYWGNGRWISLGQQVARTVKLEYEVPANALLWLRDLTKGKDERIFTYEEGKQIFW